MLTSTPSADLAQAASDDVLIPMITAAAAGQFILSIMELLEYLDQALGLRLKSACIEDFIVSSKCCP